MKTYSQFLNEVYAIDLDKEVLDNGEVYNQYAILQSIENIVATEYRERLFMPSFGSPLTGFLFENVTQEKVAEIMTSLINTIERWEKRIVIIRKEVSVSVDVPSKTMDISLPFFIKEGIGGRGTYDRKLLF